MKDKLIIIGAGGHGKVVADVALSMNRYEEVCFLDDSTQGEILGLPVVGKSEDYIKWVDEAEFFVAIGNSKVRELFQEKLIEMNAEIATLVHKSAVIGTNVRIGEGTVVMAGAVINADTNIGNGVIVNTSCSIDHDNVIEDYCHISVGSHLAGTVKVGKHTMIGAGATVINNISICEECMIGAGAVVVKDIAAAGTYIGVPAEKK